MPPYSSGIVTPNRPSSFICSTIASGNLSSWSNSSATGRISLSANWRTISVIAFCSSVSCSCVATAMAPRGRDGEGYSRLGDTRRMPVDVETLLAIESLFPEGDMIEAIAQPDAFGSRLGRLRELATDDLEIAMVGPGGFTGSFGGIEGFESAWRDWLAPFA